MWAGRDGGGEVRHLSFQPNANLVILVLASFANKTQWNTYFCYSVCESDMKKAVKTNKSKKGQTENRKGSDNRQRLLTAAAFTVWNNATLGKFAFRWNVYCLADEDYIFRNRLFYSKIYWLCQYSLKLWTFSLQCGKWDGRQNIE